MPWAASVLLAEDDVLIGALVMQYLRMGGFDSSWVRTGMEAVKWTRETDPRVLVLDLGLPGLDGFEVLAEIAAMALTPRPQILILTARNRLADVEHALELGADDYMSKPFVPNHLIGRIERLLTTKRLHQHPGPRSVAERSVSEILSARSVAHRPPFPLIPANSSYGPVA
jgi:DNA-binding response OmpR family regulator